MAAGAVCFIIWSRKATTNKERNQGGIISAAMFVSILIVTTDEIFLSKLPFNRARAFSPIFYVFWMGGIWYAIAKYQFLKISPVLVSECIVSTIDESILLLDNDFNIVRVNNAVEDIIGTQRGFFINRPFPEII